MINYPVRVVKEQIEVSDGSCEAVRDVYVVRDSKGLYIGDINTEEDAKTIVNALNAVNEFPAYAVGSSWINAVLVDWSKKFFPAHLIHHTKERDCLCCDCADR
jgi:hypothetical protein